MARFKFYNESILTQPGHKPFFLTFIGMNEILRANLQNLPWKRVDLEEVGATDFFYTDGSACGACFKLTFRREAVNDYLCTIYVFPDGTTYGGTPEIVLLVATWIRSVSSSRETCQAEDPQTISKDTPQEPENHSPASPPTN